MPKWIVHRGECYVLAAGWENPEARGEPELREVFYQLSDHSPPTREAYRLKTEVSLETLGKEAEAYQRRS